MLEIVTLNFFFKFSQTPLPFNFIRMTVSIASNQWLGILTCFFSNINRLSLFSQLQLFSFTGTKKRNHSVKMTSVSWWMCIRLYLSTSSSAQFEIRLAGNKRRFAKKSTLVMQSTKFERVKQLSNPIHSDSIGYQRFHLRQT